MALMGFPGVTVVKNLPNNAGDPGDTGDMGLVTGWEKSPGRGHGHPLQYSCLENPMVRGAWRAKVHRIAKIQTQLSKHACYDFSIIIQLVYSNV